MNDWQSKLSQHGSCFDSCYWINSSYQERLGSQILELEFSASQKRLVKSEKEKLLGQKKGALRQCVDR